MSEICPGCKSKLDSFNHSYATCEQFYKMGYRLIPWYTYDYLVKYTDIVCITSESADVYARPYWIAVLLHTSHPTSSNRAEGWVHDLNALHKHYISLSKQEQENFESLVRLGGWIGALQVLESGE